MSCSSVKPNCAVLAKAELIRRALEQELTQNGASRFQADASAFQKFQEFIQRNRQEVQGRALSLETRECMTKNEWGVGSANRRGDAIMALILIDTNLLIYADDQNDPVRQAAALSLLRELELRAAGILSVQNLAEFFNVATRQLRPPLSAMEATAQIDLLIRAFPVFDLTSLIVREAARGVQEYKFAYYDTHSLGICPPQPSPHYSLRRFQ